LVVRIESPRKSPLVEASKRGYVEIVKALLSHPSIDVNLADVSL